MYCDEKIDYTNFFKGKPQETDPGKLASIKEAVIKALKKRGVHGHISAVYYTDGNVKIEVDGAFYGVFDANTGEFFSGSVGD